MGSDTRIIYNTYKKSELCEVNYKIRKLNNGLLIGITGDRIFRQTIFAFPEVFTLDKQYGLTRKHLVKIIIPKLINILNNNRLIVNTSGKAPSMKGQILLAYHGELFEVCSNFCVYKFQDFQALGIASESAQAVLINQQNVDNVNELILNALRTTTKNSQLVGPPYLLIDTKTNEYQIIKE